MSYKNILVHLNRASRCEALLGPALELAKRQQSHLIGLYVRPRIEAAKAMDSGGHAFVLDDEIQAERTSETVLRLTFARMTEGQPFTAVWQATDAMQADLAATAVEHARVADLVIANQNDPDWEQGPEVNFPERLILETGRPVLLVPYIGSYRGMGKTVVIAWKPGPEAARAVFNAMPILKSASRVHILQIAEGRREMPAPATGLVAALARHGVTAELQASKAVDHSVGSELLSRLADLGTDLLVMGAYGHTRLREYVFGGATRDITRTMTVPTLFSH